MVSGAAALLLDARPSLTPDQVKALLIASRSRPKISPVIAKFSGAGLIRVDVAVGLPTPTTRAVLATQRRERPTVGRSPRWRHEHVRPADRRRDHRAGHAVEGTRWTGTRWTGGTWDGTRWTGGEWMGTRWTDSSWTGTRWTGTRWTGTTWTGTRWTGTTWTGTTWTGTRWTGTTWTGTPGRAPLDGFIVDGHPLDRRRMVLTDRLYVTNGNDR